MAKLKITLVKSIYGRLPKQKKTAVALGLTKIRKVVLKNDTPQIRGMVNVITHLVVCEEVND
ncbi:50S ribosomal protein L30 [bacterium]|nr:50S ribosomal protein L30 [bacterium]